MMRKNGLLGSVSPGGGRVPHPVQFWNLGTGNLTCAA
jgi:hypothetical protein